MRRLLVTLTVFLLLATPAHASWSWPVGGHVLTQYRNGADPYAVGQHRGIDIAAVVGTPVVAASGGEVRFAGTAGSSGLTVSVRTGDGYDTSYLHLSSLAVREGTSVSAGERLGAVGTTGARSALAPHLHFGAREAGTRHGYSDPLSMLPPLTAPPGEAPRPAPAPAPAPIGPSPAPAPRPAPAPAPRSAPRPAPAPRGAPRPAPAPRGAPRPAPAPHSAPAPRLAPEPRFAPAPRSTPTPVRSPRPAPRTGSAPARLGARQPSPASLDAAAGGRLAPPAPGPVASVERAKASSGPDIGWALACAGLLLAAAILTLTGDGRTASARTGAGLERNGSRLALALRPLFGRR